MVTAVSTTSAYMGAGHFAIYPTRLRLKTLEGDTKDCGLIFISTDLGHDKHQVEQIEIKMLDILEERFGFRPTGLLRFSDQCSVQFKVWGGVGGLEAEYYIRPQQFQIRLD